MALCSRHVQWGPVHFGSGISADTRPQQDFSSGVMTVLGC